MYKESDVHIYANREVEINLKKLEKNTVVGFQEGLFVDLKLEDLRDQDVQHQIYITFEKQSEARVLKNTDYDDFSLRRKIYSRSKSLTFQVYFPYIVVNKTPLDITLENSMLHKTVKQFSSIFIRPMSSKL